MCARGIGKDPTARTEETKLGVGGECGGGCVHGRHTRPGSVSAQLDLAKIRSDSPMLDLQRLRIFQTVANRCSFSAAALELSYTQSSVSEAVATLERGLGVTLLDRSSRPVGLT